MLGTAAVFASLLVSPAAALGADEPGETLPLRHYVRQTWQTAEGLPQNSVLPIVQTRDGYLWLGTQEGLVRFDGVRFAVYDKKTTPAFLHNNVSALVAARDGALWIGLNGGGVVRMHEGTARRWSTAEGLSSNAVVSLAESPDGMIWAGTFGAGLNRIAGDGSVKVFRRRDGLPSDYCHGLAAAGDSLWIATSDGVANLTNGKFRIYTARGGLADDMVHGVTVDRAGAVWFATLSGLSRFDRGRWRTFTRADGLTADEVFAVAAGHDNTIWIGTRTGGLNRLRNGRIDSYTSAEGLPDDFVDGVFEDREGNVWVGLNSGGLTRLRATPFETLSMRDGLPADGVRCILEARDGSVWVGTNGYGVAHLSYGRVTSYSTREGLPNGAITALAEARDGSIWIGTRVGVSRLRNGRITTFTTEDGLPQSDVRALLQDRNGVVWVGTVGGVCRMNADGCAPVSGLANAVVRALMERADGSIWVAGYGGLLRYRDGAVTSFAPPDTQSKDMIFSIAEDAKGVLWLGTSGGGLLRFDGTQFTRYTTKEGLFDDSAFRVLPDRDGSLWLTCNRGLSRVSIAELDEVTAGKRKTVESTVYAEADGLPASEFNGGSSPAGMLARDGRLWLPSIKGVVVVDPARLTRNELPPPVVIEHVLANKRVQPLGVDADVAPGSGALEIQYTALSFTAPARVRFRYQLENFDHDWVDAGNRRTAFYTNLPPGRYTFRVKAANNDDVWNDTGASYVVRLRPHLYQTAWFLALCALGVLVVGYAGYRLRLRQLRAREQRLAQIVDERTREADEARAAAVEASRLKSEFLANVSHEIRTPMNGVMGMTDLALDAPLTTEVRGYLETVRSSADALLHVINDILDFSKIEAGKLELAPARFDLRALVDDVLGLLAPRAAEKGLRLTSHVARGIPATVVGDEIRVRQVLINLVGNALKFTTHGAVTVTVDPDATSAPVDPQRPIGVRVAVADTGIGIAPEHQQRIFEAFAQADGSTTRKYGGTGLGLAISSQLVKLMGGELTVVSRVDGPTPGSTFSFTMWLAVDQARAEASAAAATRVEAAAPARLHVLLAEDNPVNQKVASRLLEKAGHKVTTVETGSAAVAIVGTQRFDLILMDVQMPEMNGFEATQAIRALEAGRSRTPIIAITAHAMRGDDQRCIEAGMDGYVSKPVRAQELYAEIDRVVRLVRPAAMVMRA